MKLKSDYPIKTLCDLLAFALYLVLRVEAEASGQRLRRLLRGVQLQLDATVNDLPQLAVLVFFVGALPKFDDLFDLDLLDQARVAVLFGVLQQRFIRKEVGDVARSLAKQYTHYLGRGRRHHGAQLGLALLDQ